jgi:murein DD-endopeptidase MepM/ murein hydrolase activator NlpD
MKKQYTLFLFNSHNAQIKQLLFPKAISVVLLFFVIVSFISFGISIFYFFTYNQNQVVNSQQAEIISEQRRALAFQDNQIRSLGQKFSTIKTKLIELNAFEQKIRIIADIEDTNSERSVFGVGGSTPSDLDANIELDKINGDILRQIHYQVNQMEIASIDESKGMAHLLNALEQKRNLLACTPSINPTQGWISSSFGYRKSPFTGRREFHKGLDIASHAGKAIIAPANGTVIFAGQKGLLGNALVIDHGHGLVTRYGHLQKALVSKNSTVKRGTKIALMGNTGRSTGPHLHYEIRLNGVSVNPIKYILN